jgi:DNA-binding beta-propeller fold protein YncE
MSYRVVIAFFLQALFLPVLGIAQTSRVLVLKARIPLANVQGRMDHLGVDVKGRRLFAAAFDNHTLEVIDLQAGRQVHTIRDLDKPQAAFFDASSNRLFVSSEGDGTVKIFDGTRFELLQTVKLSTDADNIRYDAARKRILVGYGGQKFLRGKPVRGRGDGALALLDSAGHESGEIVVDAHPESFRVEKSGNRVFVNVPDHQEIEVADLQERILLAHWPVTSCTDNFPMALDENHHRLFIGCRTPASLLVFDTESGKQVTSLATVSTGSDDIFYDARKSRMYVLGSNGLMDVFEQKDANHYGRLVSYPTSPGAETGLFVPEWGELFVSARAQGERSAAILVYETN